MNFNKIFNKRPWDLSITFDLDEVILDDYDLKFLIESSDKPIIVKGMVYEKGDHLLVGSLSRNIMFNQFNDGKEQPKNGGTMVLLLDTMADGIYIRECVNMRVWNYMTDITDNHSKVYKRFFYQMFLAKFIFMFILGGIILAIIIWVILVYFVF